MMKIYTPKEWLSLFGGTPSLVIDDDGYIYSADGYYKIISDSPIGKIDYANGKIYDKHYCDLSPMPIAYMVKDDDVIKILEYGKSYISDPAPFLYIKNDKIYTPEEYFRIFGGNPNGYIKKDPPVGGGTGGGTGGSTGSSTGSSTGGTGSSTGGTGGSTGSGEGGVPGFVSVLGMGLLIGVIYILIDESRIANTATVLAVVMNIAMAVYLLWKKIKGELHFQWNGKQFAKGLGLGLGVYVAATAILAALGLGSNIGSGHAVSDDVGDQMELSAIFMGVPFVIDGLFSKEKQTKKTSQTNSARTSYAGKKRTSQNYDSAPPKQQSASKPQSGENKLVICPHCGAKHYVPAGYGSIRVTCSNPNCKKQFLVQRNSPNTSQSASASKPQSGENKLVICPHCGAKHYVPTGHGSIRVTCSNPNCKKKFVSDT